MTAVSLREGRLLVPPGFATPELTLEELRGYFREYAATTIFQTGHLRTTLYTNFSDEDERRLLTAWSRLPIDHGGAWTAHRLQLMALLFGWDRARRPDFQVFAPIRYEFPGNPPLQYRPAAAQPYAMGVLTRLCATALFAGWLYMLLALATVAVTGWLAARGIALPQTGLALAVALSCLTYSLPLVLLAGSAEFRYLAWPILSALLAPPLLASVSTESSTRSGTS